MKDVLAMVLIVGIPFTLSLGWFAFWMVRLRRAGRAARQARTHRDGQPPAS
jgi:hypothetical protein